jgi:hypothetical protein
MEVEREELLEEDILFRLGERQLRVIGQEVTRDQTLS